VSEGEESPENRAKTVEMWLASEKTLSLQMLEGVEARGLIWASHTPLGEGRVLEKPLEILERTGSADKSLVGNHAVAAMGTNNHLPTFRTLCRLIARWVLELLEIVLIGGHLHIVLSVEAFTARCAGLPGAGMTLMRVIGTKCVAIVIAPTAIAGIRKHHIRVAIIADPVVTTQRFDYFPGFPTQTTARLRSRFVCRFCHREFSPLVSLLPSYAFPSCGSRTFSFWGRLNAWVAR
jgi:hypothetical protein